MSKLKRLAIPKAWPIKRKGIKFVVRPKPGPHPLKFSLPLNIILRDILKFAKSNKEVKNILNNKTILVDGVNRKDPRFPVGLFDVIEIPDKKEQFRIITNEKGKIKVYSINKSEAGLKPCKIVGKAKIKGKTQLNLFDGKNILVDKDIYKCSDTLLISLPKQEIKKHLKLEKGMTIYLMGGKHIGEIGIVESISSKKILYKESSGENFETLKKYAFVIGDKKSAIVLPKNE
jgi:small subunit ribosomal protein S4e